MKLQSGAKILQYEIVEPIGAGGMGEVYRARDTRLDRDVAIKVLSDHLESDPEMRKRFEREARAVAALSHPGILSIHELAVVDGRSIAVMELLQGESLRARLHRAGPMPWRDAALLGAQTADALAAAHAKDIIHRDLKPENIFITPDGRPKILDFGLARSTHPLSGADDVTHASDAVTEPGRLMGTLGYMAPEQVRGLEVTTASDIFAFGCTLAEMVTGERPFNRPTPAETLAAILRDDPPNLTRAAPDAPQEFTRVVGHCLEKGAADRFQSATDVALALRALLNESGSIEAPAPRRKSASRRTTNSLAVLPFVNVGGDPSTEYLADGITESIINSLSQLPRLRVTPRSTVFRYRDPDVDLKSAGLAMNVRTVVTGRVVHQAEMLNVQAELVDVVRESQIWGDQFRYPMSEIFAVQEQIAWQISEALRIRLTGEEKKRLKRRATGNTEAYQEYMRGRHQWGKWTPEGFQNAVGHFERAIEIDPLYAQAYSGLGDVYGAMAYYGFLPPQIGMPRAEAAAFRALELDPNLAEAHVTVGMVQMLHRWKWDDAERAMRRAIELNPRYAQAHVFYGLLLIAFGRLDESLEHAKRAAQIDPLAPMAQVGLAWVLYFCRRYAESLEQLRLVLQTYPGWAEAYTMIALNLERLGQYDRASAAWQNAAGGFGVSSDEAASYAAPNASAREYFEMRLHQLEAAAQSRYVPPYYFSGLYAELGQLDEAFAWLDKALDEHAGQAVFLHADPIADPLRADPRYEQAIARLGLSAFLPRTEQ